MVREFDAGDILVFQIESGFGLLRVLGFDSLDGTNATWHVRVYADFYPDVGSAELALQALRNISVGVAHAALTDRAFKSTQAGLLQNFPLERTEIRLIDDWRADAGRQISDRSIRLLLGLR